MKKFLNISAMAVSIFMILMLVVCLISLLTGFVPFLSTIANNCGVARLDGIAQQVEDRVAVQFDNLAELTDHLEGAESRNEVVSYLRSFIGVEQFGDLQYVSQGTTYSESGAEVSKGPALGVEVGSQMAVSKVQYYPLGQTRCIAMFLPVRASTAVDGVISIIPAEQLMNMKDYFTPPAQVIALVNTEGETVSVATAEDFPLNVGPDFLEMFKTFSQSKDSMVELQKMLQVPATQAKQLSVGATDYTVAVSPLSAASNGLFLVEICPSRQLLSEQRSYLQQAIVISVLAMMALFVSAIYLMISRKKTKIVEVPVEAETSVLDSMPNATTHVATRVKPVVDAASTTPAHSCETAEEFIAQATKLTAGPGFQKRFVVCSEINDYAQIEKRLGVDMANNVLFHVEKVISSICKENEYFCYGGGGCFYSVFRCASMDDVRTRTQLIKDLAKQGRGKSKIDMHIGVYQLTKSGPVKDMMQCAALAKNMVRSNTTAPYVLYSQDLVSEHQNNQKIERQMEESLKTGEFKLFLQPKYSVAEDRIDSAEALVRWFDPRKNDYIFPGAFIPLFESNGFIIKLDHFMYLEVCQYFEAAAEKGDKVYPICVNVSRVTALQPDFLNFYVSKKKHYGIADGLIDLEFSESFVSENVELLQKVIPTLNENGIRVSVDNVTAGGGTMTILKKLHVDEINIDRTFLFPGLSEERDEALQKTLVSFSKAFGIRVTQSGVENKELFDRCCDAGCELLQGYYFARAISLEEYRIFINTNTSIRYKAFVK